ncbi:MAG: redoxin domain-containing protein [Flavobacterium sp.]|nr:redoxin domain-containing protein [Flavobacterium sp.]
MKKILISAFILIILITFFLTHCGIEIGNVHIGKKLNLIVTQNENFEKSDFSTQHYSKSKLMVVNLWATWCNPCVGEIPELNEVMAEFKNDNVDFLSLSIDTDSIQLIKFLKKDKFKFTDITFKNLQYTTAILNTLEGRKSDEKITSQSVPITYLVKNKKVVSRIDGTIDKNELIAMIRKYK